MAHTIEVRLVESWDDGQIVDLYRAGGWWKERYDPAGIPGVIAGSFLFAVAVDPVTGSAVGMGRVLSDGVSDGYIQDIAVLPVYRRRGVGKKIVAFLLRECRARGLEWIGLIAEPGSEQFYLRLGFRPMKGYVPLLFDTET